MTIYRGKNGHFASKAEIAAIKAKEAQQAGLPLSQQAEQPKEAPSKKIEVFKGMVETTPGKYHCRGHEFEVGKEYAVSSPVRPCGNGFHGSPTLLSVLSFYNLRIGTVIAKATLDGTILTDSVHGQIKPTDSLHRFDKLAGEKVTIDDVMHPSHMINALAVAVEEARNHPDKYKHVDIYRATQYWQINDEKSKSGYIKYMINSASRPGYKRDMIHPAFGQHEPVLMSNVPNANIMTNCMLQYVCGAYSTSVMNGGGSIVVGGNNCNITMYGRGQIDLYGPNNKVIAWAGARVRFRNAHKGNEVTFVDPTSGVVKVARDHDEDAVIGKWMSYTTTSKVVHETKFVAEA